MRSEHQEAVENYSDVKKQNRPYILGRGLQLNDFVFKIGETYFLGEDFLSQFSVVVMNMLYHLLRNLFKVFRYLGSNTKKRRKKILGRCAGLKKRENDYEHFLFFHATEVLAPEGLTYLSLMFGDMIVFTCCFILSYFSRQLSKTGDILKIAFAWHVRRQN